MTSFTSWKDKVAQFVEVRLNLVKLTVIERLSNVLGFLIYIFILLFLSITVLIFLGIGVQETLSEVFHSRIGGAFATFGFYVLLVVIAIALRKRILNGFSSIFIAMLTAGDDDEDDEDLKGKKIKVD